MDEGIVFWIEKSKKGSYHLKISDDYDPLKIYATLKLHLLFLEHELLDKISMNAGDVN